MDERIVPYLLGELPEAEQIKLEEEYFADEEKYQLLQAAQNDLLDAYARGHLTPAERERFEHHFMASPWQRERIEIASALTGYVDRAQLEQPKALGQAVAQKPSWWQSFKDFFSPSTSRWQLAAAAVVVLILLGGGWLMAEFSRIRKELNRTQAEQAAAAQRNAQQQANLNEERRRADQLASELEREREARAKLENELAKLQQSPAPGNQSSSLLSFILTPQILRERGNLKRLTITSEVKTIELQLSFNSPAAYRSFRVALESADGRAVKNWEQLSARRTQSGQVLMVRLPAASLEVGDYLLKLSGLTTGSGAEEVANYVFRVTKE